MKIQPGQPQPSALPGQTVPAQTSPLKLPGTGKVSSGENSPFEVLNALDRWRSEEEATQKDAVRWPLEKMPLAVYVEPTLEFSLDFLTIMRQWEAASEGLIRFRSVTDPDKANIVFSWSDETVVGRDYEVGHAKREVQGTRITHVKITLIRQPLIDGHLSPADRQKRLIATVLHETGHALGLEHSKSRSDVMHHRGWKITSLGSGDVKSLKSLYRTGRQLLL